MENQDGYIYHKCQIEKSRAFRSQLDDILREDFDSYVQRILTDAKLNGEITDDQYEELLKALKQDK